MHTQLEQISLLYQDVQTEYERQIEGIKGKFEEVKEILERKERELVEDVEGRFRPLTSKLLGFVEELGKGLKANREKIEGLEGVRRMQEEEKVIRFQPVQVVTPAFQLPPTLLSRIHSLPPLSLNLTPLSDLIHSLSLDGNP